MEMIGEELSVRYSNFPLFHHSHLPVFEFETIYRFEQLEQVERREETWPATIIIIRSTITKRKES